eukprot:gene845-12117_t
MRRIGHYDGCVCVSFVRQYCVAGAGWAKENSTGAAMGIGAVLFDDTEMLQRARMYM